MFGQHLCLKLDTFTLILLLIHIVIKHYDENLMFISFPKKTIKIIIYLSAFAICLNRQNSLASGMPINLMAWEY